MKVTEQSSFRRSEAQRLADQGPVPPAASGRRLPSAPRERKPALAALAVLLIVGGALLTAFLVIQMGNRVPALMVVRTVPAGQKIVRADLQEVQVPAETEFDYIPAQQLDIALSKYAKVELVPGALLTADMTADAPEALVAGKAVVGLSLKAGQVPGMLAAGQRVQVIYVSGEEGTVGTGKVLADRATVQSVRESEGGTTLVDIVIDKAAAANVSAAASGGRVALAYLPGAKGGEASAPAITPTPQPTPTDGTPVKPTKKPTAKPTNQPTNQPTGTASPTEGG
ncbi:SAF domain-containing protein [Thermoactinospora rubra]|uniref:SAF domain-containing protein n=1 Tax=Thermoactinospora rubra TaxID=1088767 RepID=UPI000A11E863|nr:SAF domain-containing protein [Thermoactinospora rubra]